MSEFTPEELLKRKASPMMIKTFYPELYSCFLEQNLTNEETEAVFHKIGFDSAKILVKSWIPKKNDIEGIVKEIFKVLLCNKKIKVTIKNNIITIIDKACRVCWKKLEIGRSHYCMSMAGLIEGYFNDLIEIKAFKFKKVQVRTQESQSAGNAYCVHEMILL